MDLFLITLPVAKTQTWFFLPPLIAFCLSFFTSMAGVSGAFLLLPFQMSYLGFVSPSVSSTNFLYNVIGTPGGVIRFIREQRMVWPLANSFIAGALPGILLGYYIRISYLPDPKTFKLFVGIVLLGIGLRLAKKNTRQQEKKNSGATFKVSDLRASLTRVSYTFNGEQISFSVPILVAISFFIGIIGGIYGVSGGVILAPICVSFFRIPIYTAAGAVLFANFATSLAGVTFYSLIPINGQTAPPDLILGTLFGIGGLCGMYFGAKCQKHLPEPLIKGGLAFIILLVAGRYIINYFF
ncbi:MAG: sulfite exporter TauE/SafE family protein [Desulfobulbaceae bacterium]|nr:sulfite exporter TauE/SafE family protein [Desulfobulbaceae bacterium]